MNKGFLDSQSRKILTTEEKLHLARQRGVYSEYELPINKNKQNRHILGSKEFTYFDSKSKKDGKALKKKNRQARFTASRRSVLIGFIHNIQSFLGKIKKIFYFFSRMRL
ncbi:MAG: hypothetical protein II819_03245 [Fibrobacter sp.]|nr:hypothetical protein [Fibrobacter sp.]